MRLYLRGAARGRDDLITRDISRWRHANGAPRKEELHRPGPSGLQYAAPARKSDAAGL